MKVRSSQTLKGLKRHQRGRSRRTNTAMRACRRSPMRSVETIEREVMSIRDCLERSAKISEKLEVSSRKPELYMAIIEVSGQLLVFLTVALIPTGYDSEKGVFDPQILPMAFLGLITGLLMWAKGRTL